MSWNSWKPSTPAFVDSIFAAKEICRFLAKPTDLALASLKRLARYLKARPRMVFNMPFQQADSFEVYSDTDWAGCQRTRKSTSGGCVFIRGHVNKCWSATQASLALSSGGAEYYGVVKAAGIGLGIQALLRDAGVELPIRVWTDSSAAIGTAGRQGLGKLRHLECHSLWLQQRLRRKEFKLRKVAGEENPGDLFTKHLESSKKLDQLLKLFNCTIVSGRAGSAPGLKTAKGAEDQGGVSLVELQMLTPQLPLAEMNRRRATAVSDE